MTLRDESRETIFVGDMLSGASKKLSAVHSIAQQAVYCFQNQLCAIATVNEYDLASWKRKPSVCRLWIHTIGTSKKATRKQLKGGSTAQVPLSPICDWMPVVNVWQDISRILF